MFALCIPMPSLICFISSEASPTELAVQCNNGSSDVSLNAQMLSSAYLAIPHLSLHTELKLIRTAMLPLWKATSTANHMIVRDPVGP